MNTKFLYMADAHIKSRTWTNNTQIAGDAYEALKVLSEKEELKDVKSLVIGGDWFDGNRPSATDLIATVNFFKTFNTIYYITGNHDSIQPSFMSVFSSANSYLKLIALTENIITFYAPDTYIAGISWTSNTDEMFLKLQTIVQNFKDNFNSATDKLYIVMHTSFKHLLNFEGSYKISIEDIKQICGDLNINILVGDIHTRDTTYYTDRNYIHSCGSLYPLSLDKIDTKNFVSVIDATTDDIEDIPVTVRNYYIKTVHSEEDISNISISKELLPSYVILYVSDTMKNIKSLTTVLNTPDVVCSINIVHADSNVNVTTTASDTYTIQTALEEEISDPFIYSYAVDLLNSDDPISIIDSWLTTWCVTKL